MARNVSIVLHKVIQIQKYEVVHEDDEDPKQKLAEILADQLSDPRILDVHQVYETPSHRATEHDDWEVESVTNHTPDYEVIHKDPEFLFRPQVARDVKAFLKEIDNASTR